MDIEHKQLEAEVTLVNEKIRFSGSARNNPEVFMDYFPPHGDGKGYTGMEMLLLSLSGCSGTAVIALLRKLGKTIGGFTIGAKGERQEIMPTAFHTIQLNFKVVSDDITSDDMVKVIRLAETSACPVWAMLKGNVEIKAGYTIHSITQQ